MNVIRISDALVDEFERNGAVCLRGLFAQHWLDSLAVGVDKNFADPGPDHTMYTKTGEPGGFYDDYCNWQRIDEYQEFVMHSPAAEIAARLMRSTTARIYHEHVLVKEPGTREVTPWHHDLSYYGVDGDQLCSIWLPLDVVPKSACPEFVAGSHADGRRYYPRLFINHENYSDGVEGFEMIPDIDTHRDDYDILSWDLEAGDCIVFHMRTIHGAPATAGLKSRRRGFSTRWLGDDARFAVRPWQTSPPYREVDLKPGDAMDHPSFPVVWPA
ncbi:MAG: phytanoyl-CoA dioxygenase family protein [Gammaproteobacteria bacterium]|nr:phytanoyl-CoA dioxygenase family protein [Gammaproteobacteria bacterium]MDH3466066.1 phytanoyl-CoA dioxygenase family protein [Gammaproteobacteria bacterium]